MEDKGRIDEARILNLDKQLTTYTGLPREEAGGAPPFDNQLTTYADLPPGRTTLSNLGWPA